MICIGIEGSANKIGIGIIKHDATIDILANIRNTFIPPPGHGFLPRQVAAHHAEKILPLIKQALDTAKISRKEIDAIAFTKGSYFPTLRTRNGQPIVCMRSSCENSVASVEYPDNPRKPLHRAY